MPRLVTGAAITLSRDHPVRRPVEAMEEAAAAIRHGPRGALAAVAVTAAAEADSVEVVAVAAGELASIPSVT